MTGETTKNITKYINQYNVLIGRHQVGLNTQTTRYIENSNTAAQVHSDSIPLYLCSSLHAFTLLRMYDIVCNS